MSRRSIVIRRELRRTEGAPLPVVVDVLECGHEIVDTGPRADERECRQCMRPLFGLQADAQRLQRALARVTGLTLRDEVSS